MLIATARDSIGKRIEGLDAGADDYVLKPYDLNELLARIRSLLRRAAGRGEPVYEHKGVCINPATREGTVSERPVSLAAREWAVFEALLARLGAVLSRAQLEEKLCGWGDEINSNAVEVYIPGRGSRARSRSLLPCQWHASQRQRSQARHCQSDRRIARRVHDVRCVESAGRLAGEGAISRFSVKIPR